MVSKSVYALTGLFVGAVVNILFNLIAAAIQQRAFADQFSNQSLWWLVGLALIGLLLGYWLSGNVTVPASDDQSQQASGSDKGVTMTRLRALLSSITLRGKGIKLTDVFSFGSRIDIDTKD